MRRLSSNLKGTNSIIVVVKDPKKEIQKSKKRRDTKKHTRKQLKLPSTVFPRTSILPNLFPITAANGSPRLKNKIATAETSLLNKKIVKKEENTK